MTVTFNKLNIRERLSKFESENTRSLDFAELPEKMAILLRSG